MSRRRGWVGDRCRTEVTLSLGEIPCSIGDYSQVGVRKYIVRFGHERFPERVLSGSSLTTFKRSYSFRNQLLGLCVTHRARSNGLGLGDCRRKQNRADNNVAQKSQRERNPSLIG